MYGLLVPLGGGDPIPLLKKKILVGRRESCDVVLRFPNVSAHHCELMVENGYWYVQDLNSRNGVKVDNRRVEAGEKRVDPGVTLTIAKHRFELRYTPAELGAVGPPPDDEAASILGKSLLERAGLTGKKRSKSAPSVKDIPSDDEGNKRMAADEEIGKRPRHKS